MEILTVLFYFRYLSSNITGRDRSVIHIIMNESQGHDFVAIASILNAAWELQRKYGDKHLNFMSKFINSDGENAGDSNIRKGAVEIDKLHEKASEYFLLAEAINHQDGLCKHTFNNAIHWLEHMTIISVNNETRTISVDKSKDILSKREKLLSASLDESYALKCLKAQFLADRKFS